MVYAINRRTREHRALKSPYDLAQVGSSMHWRIVETDEDGWIEWKGGDCPLPGDVLCDAINLHEKPAREAVAGTLDWSEVKAYRPVLDEPLMKPGARLCRGFVSARRSRSSTQQPVAWDGEGLPPVGVDCKLDNIAGPAKTVSIVAHHMGNVVFFDGEEYDGALAKFFRPIRTDRERWIEAALKECTEHISQRQLGKLYDAGLAKLPE